MNQQYFHFTLGPVQGFVAQARRTRDFWAGSFLLSWLSAVAQQAIIKQGGEIIFPKVEKGYLAWLEDKGQGQLPQQGCIPNRFKGGLAKVPQDFQPEQIGNSVKHAWQALADWVWQQDLEWLGDNAKSRDIWQRQVEHFWEISWALSDNEQASDLLDRRKNWRNYLPPEEAGVKCMMMDGWQEISGIPTPNAKELKAFWDGLRRQSDSMANDLRESEYLCAIAFIKRRFARHFADFKTSMPGGWSLHGWRVNPSVPSVTYIAAAPWLAQVLKKAPEDKLKPFHDTAKTLTQGYGEYNTWLDCIDQAVLERGDGSVFWNTKNLDGNVFFDTALQNPNIYPDQTQSQKVLAALGKLRQSVEIEPVSPFYAVLMMDGDSLGKQMTNIAKQESVSQALSQFTSGVTAIVEKYSGFLVYAGGDDVLALLPLENALNCAKELRDHYLTCCQNNQINSTLSGAIEYAHINMPLGKVLGDAHHLLDDIAKDQTGRDSIAVRVWKPGGQHLQWTMPWKKAIADGEVVMQRLADDFRADQQQTPFSNSFFFHIEERFALLSKNHNTTEKAAFESDTLIDLIAADYLSSGVNQLKKTKKVTLEQARNRIQPLLKQCFEWQRNLDDNDQESFTETHRLNPSGLRLIRFLAQKGVDHG